jgi:hypothetical protein
MADLKREGTKRTNLFLRTGFLKIFLAISAVVVVPPKP